MRRVFFIVAVSLAIFAKDAQSQVTLAEISAFAKDICDEIRIDGKIARREIEGKLSGEAGGVAKVIGLSVGADGKIRDDQTEYKGLPFDKVAQQMQSARECRQQVAKMLFDERTRIAAAKAGSAPDICKTWTGPGIPFACLGKRNLPGIGIAPEGYTWCILDARFNNPPNVQSYCFARENAGRCQCEKVAPGYPLPTLQMYGRVYEGR